MEIIVRQCGAHGVDTSRYKVITSYESSHPHQEKPHLLASASETLATVKFLMGQINEIGLDIPLVGFACLLQALRPAFRNVFRKLEKPVILTKTKYMNLL